MKRIIPLLCLGMLILFACEQVNDVKPAEAPVDLGLENLDLSSLSFELDLNQTLDFGRADEVRFSEFLDEVTEAIFPAEGEALESLDLTISDHQIIVYAGTRTDQFTQKRGGCDEDDGWTTVGKGKCRNRDCIRDRVEVAFEEAGDPGAGNCVDVRVDRGTLGASVCYQVVTDC